MHGYVTRLTPIDVTSLAAEALDAPALASVLTGAGFEGGVERRFTARARPARLISPAETISHRRSIKMVLMASAYHIAM